MTIVADLVGLCFPWPAPPEPRPEAQGQLENSSGGGARTRLLPLGADAAIISLQSFLGRQPRLELSWGLPRHQSHQ